MCSEGLFTPSREQEIQSSPLLKGCCIDAPFNWGIWALRNMASESVNHILRHGELGKYILCDKEPLLLISRGSWWLTPNSYATPRGWVLTNCNKSLPCQWWTEEGTCDQPKPTRDVCRGLLEKVSSHWRSRCRQTSGQVVGLLVVLGGAAAILGHERGQSAAEAPGRPQRWKERPRVPHSALDLCEVIHSFLT